MDFCCSRNQLVTMHAAVLIAPCQPSCSVADIARVTFSLGNLGLRPTCRRSVSSHSRAVFSMIGTTQSS